MDGCPLVFRIPDQLDRNTFRVAFFWVANGVLDVADAVDLAVDSRVRVTADVKG